MDIRVTNQPISATNSKSSFSGSVFEIIFLIIIIVVGYFYLVSPKQTAYNEISDQLTSLKKKQDTLKTQKEAFDKLVQELEAQPEAVAQLDSTLPLDNKPSRLYVLLENLIQGSGLTTGTVSVDSDAQAVVAGAKTATDQAFATDHKIKPTTISVSASGTVDQLTGFLTRLETSTRLLEVNSLDISQGRGDQLIFKVGLKAYSYSPDPAAANATVSK